MTPPPAGLGWSAADLERVGASGLGGLYTEPAVAAAERDRIFRRAWSLVAAAEDLDGGRYVTADVGAVPIVVWRDAAGTCRAFHNMCRHRGIPLLAGAGPLGRHVTCPYHQWSFGTDGALVACPQPEQFPGLDRGPLGLLPVPVVEWHGLIFACPAADPPDFDETVAPLARRLAAHLRLPLTEVARATYHVACNWKLLVENHVDVYHLWYLHQRSLAAYHHRAFEWDWEGATWWSFEPMKHPAGPAGSAAGLPGLPARLRDGIGAHLLWPNLMVVTTGDYLATYDARPLDAGRSEVTLRVRALPGADGPALVASIRAFLAEDVAACESLQAAAASPVFAVGPTACSHERPVRLLHRMLRAALADP